MADVALVGFPNVGKSTFIAAISAAKPKIADYPFTTLQPNLGVVRLDDGFEMVVADIPGLVEGAAEGRGLGHQFLRHIERSKALVIMVDLSPTALMDPATQAQVLLDELADYQPELLSRPRVLVGSRSDLAAEADASQFDGLELSAVTGHGVPAVLTAMRNAVQAARDAYEEPDSWVVHRPAPEGFWIGRADDGSWEVNGKAARRAVAFNDLTNPEALDEAHKRLKKLGVLKALAKKGVREGELVSIGRLAFEYSEDTA